MRMLALATLAGCHRKTGEEPAPAQEEKASHRWPGVSVVPMTGHGVWIRLVGQEAWSNSPLYLVDGGSVRVRPGGGIDWLDIDEIVQIKVLRDPAETAVYGPRGANGVIVITTATSRERRN